MTKLYKNLLILSALLFSLKSIAQPIVNSDFLPVLGAAGSHQMEVILPGPLRTAPTTGANQVWDYTALTNPGEINPMSVSDTNGLRFRGPYASANAAYKHYMFGDNPIKYNSTGVYELGYGTGDTTQALTRPYAHARTILPLGLAYNGSFGDSIDLYNYAGGNRNLELIVAYQAKYVGYGTIRFIDATDGSTDVYSNVILVHYRIRLYSPSSLTAPFEVTDYYNWHVKGLGLPLAQWQHHTGGAPGEFWRFDRVGALQIPPAMTVTNTGYLPRASGTGVWNREGFSRPLPATGGRKVWDYTDMTHTPGSPVRLEIKVGSDVPAGVANANLAVRIYQTNLPSVTETFFYKTSETGIAEVGRDYGTPTAIAYQNEVPHLRIPLRLGQSTRDSILARPNEYQTVRMKFLGYGTLKLPNGMVDTNTVLIKTQIRRYSFGNFIDSTTRLSYYSKNMPLGYPYAYEEYTSNGNSLNYVSDFVAGNQPAINPATLSLAPNPAGNELSVHGQTGASHTTISDISGRVVRSHTLSAESTSVDVSSLKPGLYLLTVETAGGPVTKRFAKE